jgi:hypothetical protein
MALESIYYLKVVWVWNPSNGKTNAFGINGYTYVHYKQCISMKLNKRSVAVCPLVAGERRGVTLCIFSLKIYSVYQSK